MNKILMLAFLLPLYLSSRAQIKKGKVIYEQKADVYRRLPDPGMKSMIPQFNKSRTELIFSGDVSLYKNIKEEEDIRDKAGEDNNRVIMKFGGGDDELYKDYTAGLETARREMGPKFYIITDTLPKQSWKLLPDTMTIRGYVCKKAMTTSTREGKPVVAWYTEDIQVPAGPGPYGGLPGLIMALDVNEGEIVFSVLDMQTGVLDASIVRAPTDGKKISRAAFQKMMDEQMGGRPGEGVKMRIIHN